MIITDFKCSNCGKTFEVYKNSIQDNFPEVCKCPFCGNTNSHRIWKIGGASVCEGSVGNAKNGYENTVTYHPASHGRFKGKKIKGE